MSSPLALFLAGFFALTPQQEHDSMLYMQSLVTPALFEHCKALQPDRAAAYDAALTAWNKKNKRAVARGEKTVRRLSGGDAAAADMLNRAEADATLAEIRQQPVNEQNEHCSRVLDITRDEG